MSNVTYQCVMCSTCNLKIKIVKQKIKRNTFNAKCCILIRQVFQLQISSPGTWIDLEGL